MKNIKKTVSIILAVLTVLLCTFCLTGCVNPFAKQPSSPKSEDNPLSIALVMSATRNFPALYATQSLYDRIYAACYSYGSVSGVTIEGTPRLCADFNIQKPDKNITTAKRKTLATQNTNAILNECFNAKAETEEVDTLAAIKQGSEVLCAKPGENTREMYVISNGLCTTGLLNQVSHDTLSVDANLVVEKLSALHSLPDLHGVTVYWSGLAATAGKQSAIPDSYKFKLQTLWTAIVESAGGSIVFDSTPLTGNEAEGLPSVSTVIFPEDILDLDFTSVDLRAPIVFNEETVKFVPNEAVFVDEKAAREALQPICTYLKEDRSRKAIIAGTTASAGGDGYELSRERADACADLLCGLGVNPAQLECIGLGCSENCFHKDDLNTDGTLNEEVAKLNRAIYIFSPDSETAARLNTRNL